MLKASWFSLGEGGDGERYPVDDSIQICASVGHFIYVIAETELHFAFVSCNEQLLLIVIFRTFHGITRNI